MSKFKSSMYFWLSLFAFENSSIIFWSSSFCLLIFSMHSLFFCLLANVSFLLFSVFSTSSFNLSIRFWICSIFSSIEITLCFSVAYVISVSCNCFSNACTSSIISSDEFIYSSLSFSNFWIFSFNFFISFSKLSISLLLPKMLTVFFATEPPVIAPDGFITSPSIVIILNE